MFTCCARYLHKIKVSLSCYLILIVIEINDLVSNECYIIMHRELRRSEHGRILINLSVSLICVYVVFVIAGLVTSVEVLCGLVSALFQYFMLVFFGWTAAEAVYLLCSLFEKRLKATAIPIILYALVVWCKYSNSYSIYYIL